MTDYEIIAVLHDLSNCKHVYAKYSDSQYEFAIQYAINKIRSYNDVLRMYKTLSEEYADYVEKKKHEIPLPDNY